jgi:nucleoside-diphosphate-sugar epimerase
VEGDWPSVRDINIDGTHNVYEAARQAGVRRIVHASSNAETYVVELAPDTHDEDEVEATFRSCCSAEFDADLNDID